MQSKNYLYNFPIALIGITLLYSFVFKTPQEPAGMIIPGPCNELSENYNKEIAEVFGCKDLIA